MKKDDVYKLIKYNGIYNDEVKSNLKKLIKKYHPDKMSGDSKIIKVIYEVKRELENNSISYNPKKKEKTIKKDISSKEIKSYENSLIYLNKDKVKLETKIKMVYGNLSINLKKYSKLYHNYCQNKALLCEIKDEKIKCKKIKEYELLLYILFIVGIILYLINQQWFILPIILLIALIIGYINYQRVNKLNKINRQLDYFNEKDDKFNKEIKVISTTIDDINNNIRDLERLLIKIDNDIRFYNNRLNK